MKTTLLTLVSILIFTFLGHTQNIQSFKKDGKLGIKLGKEIICEPKYDKIFEISDGFVMVMFNGKYGFVAISGQDKGREIPCIYDEARSFFRGVAWVKLDNKWGFIGANGKEVTPIKYDEFKHYYFVKIENQWIFQFAIVKINDKYGLVDKNGVELAKCIYDEIFAFDNDLFKENTFSITNVKKNGKWGFMDNTGKEIIECQYEKASRFSDGKAEVTLNGRTFYIDKNGNEIK